MDLTSESTTAAVIESFAQTADPRLRAILQELVPHLHDFVRKVRLTLPEWEAAVEFLTAVGQKCDANRQEFILLSDVLGISMLVETLGGQEAGTESTVLGPFHVVASPERENGDNIDLIGGADPCVVTGRVLGTDGTPLAGATVDVWQCSEDGFYDVQQPDVQPLGNGRGLFHTDAEGRFGFRTVVPSHYPIPTDGPVGKMLLATGRHPFRPAHIHFIVEAPGHRSLTTHIFVAGSPYLDSDAVFAVKKSLIADFEEVDDPEQAVQHGVSNPFRAASIDLVLEADHVG
jgi:hydroxyquinol 1,2-dioxygenase